MNRKLTRAVIETILRKAIAEIKEAPKRGTRALVDLALTAVDGRFQNYFLQMIQTMLEDENSAYYKMIPDLVGAIETDKIVTFGLNLGYNSCTAGARKIRAVEKEEHYNVPWTITLELSGEAYAKKETNYRFILEQGKALGIYTWMIVVKDNLKQLPSLVRKQPDCAFVLYCEPEEITDTVLDETADINNLMFAVHDTGDAEKACHLLRSRQLLYSVYDTCGESDQKRILSGELLGDAEQLHPVFAGVLTEPGCSKDTAESIYQYVVDARKGQKYATVPWDIINDDRFVDSVISEGPCQAIFDSEGNLRGSSGMPRSDCNLFGQPLPGILKRAFPKAG